MLMSCCEQLTMQLLCVCLFVRIDQKRGVPGSGWVVGGVTTDNPRPFTSPHFQFQKSRDHEKQTLGSA